MFPGNVDKKVIHIIEPRWPAFIAMLAAATVYLALPAHLVVGPRWLLLALIAILLVPIVVTGNKGLWRATRALTFAVTGLVTFALIGSLIYLVREIPKHDETPIELMHSAIALWVTNILVFALWYWKLDGGGPIGRAHTPVRIGGSFLFPQLMRVDNPEPNWTPNFVDYLFLAFNTSTAFSPTDTAVLSRWAKLLTMLQALISLAIIAFLAARAVNVL